MATRVLKQSDGSVFIQLEPGRDVYYLGDCVDLDSIPNPRGDVEPIYCRTRDRSGYVAVGKRKSPPGTLPVTLTELMQAAASWLETVECPFTLYVSQRTCGLAGVFDNWDRMYAVGGMEITDDPISNLAHHVDDNETMHEYTLSGEPPRLDLRIVAAGQLGVAETLGFKFVSGANRVLCPGLCTGSESECGQFIAGAAAGVGVTANVSYSFDGGATISVAAADPFAINEDIITGAIISVGREITRWIVARETDAGNPLEIAYSDDLGATWTLVEVGSTNGEAAAGPKALVALDADHLWLATSLGEVYFSSDGGETWAAQNATGASGGLALYAMSFADELTGFAVGDTDTVIETIDGGVTWSAATATGLGVDLLSVQCFSRNRVIVGSAVVAAGSLVISFDGGATWEHLTFTGQATEAVEDMHFYNDHVGLIVTDTAGPVGSLHRTVNGGKSWQEITAPSNAGVDSVWMCKPNSGYAAGPASGGTGMLIKVNG